MATAIENRCAALGGSTSVVGTVDGASPERWLSDNFGRLAGYANGFVMWSPTWGANYLTGALAAYYRSLPEFDRLIRLGYLLIDETGSENEPGLQVAIFEHGRLYLRPSGVAEVYSDIYRRWADDGGQSGPGMRWQARLIVRWASAATVDSSAAPSTGTPATLTFLLHGSPITRIS
jgi:hypothetical protein